MIGFYIVSLAVFVVYNIAVIVRFGVPTSISESCYLWPAKYGRHLFFAFCILTALPLMIFWLHYSEGTFQLPIFLACGALMFVGAAAEFKKIGLTRNVHFGSALVCAAGSQLWIALYTKWWIVSLGAFALAVFLSSKIKGVDSDTMVTGIKKNATLYFFEMAAFVSPYFAAYGCYLDAV